MKTSNKILLPLGCLLVIAGILFGKKIKDYIMEYFTIKELTKTSTGLSNVPNEEQKAALIALVENILDPARKMLGKPITVNSGFRSTAVNAKVGGAASSQHTKGEAADITCYDNAKLFEIIRKYLPYDQLIWEYGNNLQPKYIHVSFKRNGANRAQALRYDGAKYTNYA